MNDSISYPVPSSWAWTTLGDICQIARTQVNPKARPRDRFNYLSIENIEANSGELVNFTPTLGKEIKSSKIAFTREDILYSKLRPYLNKVYLPSFDGVSATDLVPLKPHAGIVREYVGHYLRTRHVVEYAKLKTRGIQLPRIPVEDLLGLPIPVPPSAEQQRIATKLEKSLRSIKVARTALRRLPVLADKLRRAILTKAFCGELTERDPNDEPAEKLVQKIEQERRKKWEEDLIAKKKDPRKYRYEKPTYDSQSDVEIREDWVQTHLGFLVVLQNGKALPKAKRDPRGAIPVYGGNGFIGNHSKSLVGFATIVLGRVGANCGNVHLAPSASWVTDNAIYATWISPCVHPKYLMYFLRYRNLNDLSGGTGQPYVSQELLYPVVVPVPSLGEQTRIVALLEGIFERQNAIEYGIRYGMEKAAVLEQSILFRAFRGKLVSQDPSDEPASALLERIRAQRAAMGKKTSHRKL
jgi:type I restriction enzyme S subunit